MSLTFRSAIALAAVAPGDGTPFDALSSNCSDPSLVFVGDEPRLAVSAPGPETGEPLLLLGGTDQQLIDWPTSLISTLRAEGFVRSYSTPVMLDARPAWMLWERRTGPRSLAHSLPGQSPKCRTI
jgi:hypothetical protein